MRFTREDATREYVSPLLVRTAIRDCRLRPEHAATWHEYRHYLTIGVVRTTSLTVITEAAGKREASLEAAVPSVVEVSTGVKAERKSESVVRYSGATPLAIGVELVELTVDDTTETLGIKPSDLARRIRGTQYTAFLGDPEGDAFVAVGEL